MLEVHQHQEMSLILVQGPEMNAPRLKGLMVVVILNLMIRVMDLAIIVRLVQLQRIECLLKHQDLKYFGLHQAQNQMKFRRYLNVGNILHGIWRLLI